tara:strand:+ start:121 stop:774 length:654 start_codon:yes stop_codon:yes gene_type:complete
MDKIAKLKKNPSKVLAVELCAFNPEMTVQQIADKVGVSKGCIENWKRSPEFIDAVYDRYMLQFGMEIPQVLESMVREAKAGNVQAGRLILEHSGKLVKNINVTIDSPFEKFLKSVPDAEVVEDSDIIEAAESVDVSFEDLPPRNTESQYKREKRETAATKDLIKKAETNAKQKVWYKWRKRAKAVGVEPLKSRRPTPAQRKDWERSIVEAEKLANSE